MKSTTASGISRRRFSGLVAGVAALGARAHDRICEAMGRLLRGNANSASAEERASHFPRLAALARTTMEQA